jgi:hypothetical protein
MRLIACVWLSGIGEIGASLGWGLYNYQFGNVPLFVPPGHALLYLGGLIIAERLPRPLARRGPYLLAIAAAPLFLWLAWTGADRFSLPLFALFAAFIVFGPEKRLYATMFLLALAMELYGTAVGNWAWRAHVPGTGLSTLNPPLAAGAFYCLLDWAVNLNMRMRKPPPAAGPAPEAEADARTVPAA